MKKTPFIECEDVGNSLQLQAFNAELERLSDLYFHSKWRNSKYFKRLTREIYVYLYDIFGNYIWKEISIKTHTWTIQGVLTEISDNLGIVGPFLRVKKQSKKEKLSSTEITRVQPKAESLSSTEIIWVQLLQYGYTLKVRDSTLEIQDSVQEQVAELVH